MQGYGEFLVVWGGWLDDGWMMVGYGWMVRFFVLVGCGVPLCLKWIC